MRFPTISCHGAPGGGGVSLFSGAPGGGGVSDFYSFPQNLPKLPLFYQPLKYQIPA